MKQTNILIILILFLATILRFYRIDSYPALNPDEAALGYNAYSLIKTGLDEHGMSWPLHFKSFGDYKPGGYVYLDIPFVYALGLNTFATRLPNLLLSILSIYFLFKLALNFTNNKNLSLLFIFLISISPWHIHFSRGAWESSTALSLTIIAIYLYQKNKYSTSALLFAASMYTYHSARIVTPAIILLLIFVHKKFNKKFAIILVLATLPTFISFLKNGGTTRFGGVGITADQGPLWRANELLNHDMSTSLPNRIIHNKRILYSLSWLEKYTSHFNLNFLYNTGDMVPRSKVPNMGQSHLILMPFFILGVYFLYQSNNFILKQLIFGLLFLSPLAASLTFQSPSALRSLPLVIPLEFITSYGLYSMIQKFKYIKYPFYVFLTYSILFYLNSYYNRYKAELPTSWPWNAKNTIQAKEYTQIQADQPYIMYLFYTGYDPSKLHNQIKLTPPDQYGFSTVESIDEIIFKPQK